MLVTRMTRAERLLGLLLIGLALAVPVAWIVGGYLLIPVTEVLGFYVDDGLCEVGAEPIGLHCFSDFSVVTQVLAATTPWDPDSIMVTIYPATGWLIPVIVYLVGVPLGGVPFATLLFVSIGLVFALIPAIWTGLRDWHLRMPLSILVLGFGALPILIATDRGNAIVFIVIPVFLLVLGLLRDKRSWVIAGIAIATIIKPQLILLALVFIPARRIRDFALTVAWSALGLLGGFLIWPGNRVENIRDWLTNLVSYSDYGVVDVLYPYNLSISRTILTVSDITGVSALIGDEIRGHLINLLTRFSFIPGIIIVIVTVLVLALRGRNVDPLSLVFVTTLVSIIVPGTSFSYYVILLIPIAAVLLRSPISPASSPEGRGRWFGYLDEPQYAGAGIYRFRFWVLAVVVVATTVPLVIPIPEGALPGIIGVSHVGLLQILWGPLLALAWFLVLASSFWRGSKPDPDAIQPANTANPSASS